MIFSFSGIQHRMNLVVQKLPCLLKINLEIKNVVLLVLHTENTVHQIHEMESQRSKVGVTLTLCSFGQFWSTLFFALR